METEKGQTVILHNLWEWAKRVLAGEELSNLLLDKDIWGRKPGIWQQRRNK